MTTHIKQFIEQMISEHELERRQHKRMHGHGMKMGCMFCMLGE